MSDYDQEMGELLLAALKRAAAVDCERCYGTGFYTVETGPDSWADFTCECDAGKALLALDGR